MTFKAAAPIIARDSPDMGFELLGFDFMLDTDLNVYLIEVNQNPCLETLCDQQRILITNLVADTLSLTIDPVFALERSSPDVKHTPDTYKTRYELVYFLAEE